jgi:hypothetical protein
MTKETHTNYKNLISLKNKAKYTFLISLAIFIATLFTSADQRNTQQRYTHDAQFLSHTTLAVELVKAISLATLVISGITAFYASSKIPKFHSMELIQKYRFEDSLKKATGLSLDEIYRNYDDVITDFIKNYSYLKEGFGNVYIIKNRKKLIVSKAYFQFCFPALIKYIKKKEKSRVDKENLHKHFTKIYQLVTKDSQV